MLVTGLVMGLLPSVASALTVTGLLSPDPLTVTCPAHPGYSCTTTAYTAQVLPAGYNESFQRAWNTIRPGEWNPAGWTLNWSPDPLDITLDITTYRAFDLPLGTEPNPKHYSGAEIRMAWTPAPDQTDLLWIQAMHDSLRIPQGLPYLLDVGNYTKDKPPVYMYQYTDQHFYDAPHRWCVADQHVFWDSYLYLTRVDRTNKVCTVYEGVFWGFAVDCAPVPEPSSMVGLAFCLSCLLVTRISTRIGTNCA